MSDSKSKPQRDESEKEYLPGCQIALLTREGLSHALKVSVITVDRMIADGDITPLKLRGKLVRFYLPDVVRQLTARALVSKRGCARRLASGVEGGAPGVERKAAGR